MMILSAWRYVAMKDNSFEINCIDPDIDMAVNIVDVLLYHGLRSTQLFTKPKVDEGLHSKILSILGTGTFTSGEYTTKFVELGGKKRMAQRNLQRQQGKPIIKIDHGKFRALVA